MGISQPEGVIGVTYVLVLRAGGKGVKTRLILALSDQRNHSAAVRADIAKLLLQFATDSLFAKIGCLAKVRNRPL